MVGKPVIIPIKKCDVVSASLQDACIACAGRTTGRLLYVSNALLVGDESSFQERRVRRTIIHNDQLAGWKSLRQDRLYRLRNILRAPVRRNYDADHFGGFAGR